MFHLAFWLVEFGVCIWSDSYLYCGTVVYCCRWVQKTELIWMAGARQARRRGHTRWLRYPELTSLAHFQSINGLEVKIGRNLWKFSSIRFIYFPCYVTYFMLPSLGMWHRVQMAGVLLIRELDFLLLLQLLLLLLLFLPERGVREGSRGILPVCHLWESLKNLASAAKLFWNSADSNLQGLLSGVDLHVFIYIVYIYFQICRHCSVS